MAEIVPVVSESLEASFRDLVPSQRGFGEDLQASNVILPIIDLTAAAQGSDLDVTLRQSLAFGSQTAFNITNTTTNIATSPGFYRLTALSFGNVATGQVVTNQLDLSDGFSTKTIFLHIIDGNGGNVGITNNIDLIIFLAASITLSGTTNASIGRLTGSIRQVADVNGNLVNPAGFTPQ